jgi:integrase
MSDLYTIGKLRRTRADQTAYWSYCVKWYDGGKRKRYSLGTTDKVEARSLARKYWRELHAAEATTIGPIVERYLDGLDGLKDEKRKREAWVAAKPYWADMRPEIVDADVSAEYGLWRNRATNTIRNELSLIRTALRWATDQKLISNAPKIIVPAMPDSNVEHLTKPEFRQFIKGCVSPHVRLFAMLAVASGARSNALFQCKWDQLSVDLNQLNLMPVDIERVSNKGRSIVALNDQIMTALHEAAKESTCEYIIEYYGKPIKKIRKGIAAASKRTGIHVTPHMFRHSAAVWMAEDRIPMSEIAAFLGHKDSRITERVYARYSPDFLRKASESLTW